MRTIRVRTKNADRMVEALRAAGYEARRMPGQAKTSLDNGCGDPECCPQHPASDDPSGSVWCNVETNASGTKAHKIWAAAGIVPE